MKRTANMATMPGREKVLERTLQSLVNQFDVVRVFTNPGVVDPPAYFHNVEYWATGEDLTDNGKFFMLDYIETPELYFTVDDDIVYPVDYAERMTEAIRKYHCVVTIHGRRLKGPDLNYYRGHHHVHCAHRHDKHQWVDVPGSGVAAWDTRMWHPRNLANSNYKRMSDVVLGHAAAMDNRKVLAISKRAGWVQPQVVKTSIWSDDSRKPNLDQIKLCNEIWHEKQKLK